MLAVGVLLSLALGAGWWWADRPSSSVPVVPMAGSTLPDSVLITVHVAGGVRRPGLVEVPTKARVADAVAAAGGAAAGADLAALNLAAPVRDGDQIVVPLQGDPASVVTGFEQQGSGRIRINAATAAQLEAIPGVGPVLAGRIVAHREQFGLFATVEDLLDVPGIGEAKLAALRDSVQVP